MNHRKTLSAHWKLALGTLLCLSLLLLLTRAEVRQLAHGILPPPPVVTTPAPAPHQPLNASRRLVVAVPPVAGVVAPFALPQVVVAGGGGQDGAADNFTLQGTIAPGALGSTTAGSFGLSGGFWSSQAMQPDLTATKTNSVMATTANGASVIPSAKVNVNPLTMASITVTENSGTNPNDGIICAGASATLTASGGTSYAWSTGANTAAVTVSTAGTYTVTVTDINGIQTMASQTITVNPLPTPSITVTENSGTPNDGIIYAGASATLTASGGTSYAWSNGANTPSITVMDANNYTVTVTNANGCQATVSQQITTIAVTENSGTTPNDGIICAGASATLTVSGGISYAWSTGANTAAVTVSTAGTYTVTVTHATGIQTIVSQTITVNPLPTASITVTENSGTPNDGIIYAGASATLTASGGTSYAWSNGANTPSITVMDANNYTVTVTNANGCRATVSQQITIIAVTENSGTTPNDGIICAGASATLTVSGGISYAWSTGANTAAITVSTAGTYTVTVTHATGIQTIVSQTITVNPLPTPSITVTENSGTPNDGIICAGASATLTASGGTSYAWSTGANTAAITVSTAGNYTVTVTNANGCRATTMQTITVNPVPSTPAITAGGPTTFCSGGSVTLNSSSATGNQWFLDGNAIPGATGPSYVANASGNYTVVVTSVGCPSTPSAPIVVTVTPNNTINRTSAAGTDAQTACLSTPITNITYATSGATGATFSGLPAGVNGSFAANTVTISGTPSVVGTFNYTVTLTGGCGTVTANGSITVLPPPTISINNVTQVEGDTGTTAFNFTVSLSAPNTCNVVTVTYATANGTATAGSDYIAIPPTPLTFGVGETAKTVTVQVIGDTLQESNETFFVNLSNPINATLTGSQGIGTILDNDFLRGGLTDPLACTGPGTPVNGTLQVINPNATAQPFTLTTTLTNLVGLPNTCTVTGAQAGATCTVTATGLTTSGTLAAGATANVQYQAQIADGASGTAGANSTATVAGIAATANFTAPINCPTAGPGALAGAGNQLSDQKPGSVLVYNLFTSGVSATSQNTRINLTNTHPSQTAYVHLFFVDGSSCSVADVYVCLTGNQTASFLASDFDPGTTGYLVAVATDRNGCPINFNYLIGDEYVKLSSGHAANLGAEAIAAIAGGLPACSATSSATATLAFDGVSYNLVPRVLAANNIPSRADGNDSILFIHRVGGNLATGAATINGLFGILYDDAENPYSLTIGAPTCQVRVGLNNNLRVTPRLETLLPAGRSGWLKLSGATDVGLLGTMLTANPNVTTNSGAFAQGHNLHKLTLTRDSYVIPVFPPNC